MDLSSLDWQAFHRHLQFLRFRTDAALHKRITKRREQNFIDRTVSYFEFKIIRSELLLCWKKERKDARK